MNLREWLFKNGLKITYFAAVLKVDRTYVHKWMKGQRIPSEKIMRKVREMSLNQVEKIEDLKDPLFTRKALK